MKLAKHFPLGDHFINFHSFFSWLCRGRPCKGITVLDSKFKTRGFRIPGTGFRILIVSGLRIPRVLFRSPKPRILDSMGKNFLDSRFHEQKFPGFRGRILYNGAIGENWCWSLLRLNWLRRKPKLNSLCYNSADFRNLKHIKYGARRDSIRWRCLGAEKSSRYVERGNERKILPASTVCCSSW